MRLLGTFNELWSQENGLISEMCNFTQFQYSENSGERTFTLQYLHFTPSCALVLCKCSLRKKSIEHTRRKYVDAQIWNTHNCNSWQCTVSEEPSYDISGKYIIIYVITLNCWAFCIAQFASPYNTRIQYNSLQTYVNTHILNILNCNSQLSYIL